MPRTFTSPRTLIVFAAKIVAFTYSTYALAQTPETYPSTPPGPFHQPVAPFPIEQGFSQDHASTAAEGFLRGKAEVIQALGNFQLSESQSRILRQQARWLERENKLKQTEALFTQQKMWDDARVNARVQQRARSVQGQQMLVNRQSTVYRQAYQLASDEFDSATGTITWPVALLADKFAVQRLRIEQLMQQQASYGDPKPAVTSEIARATECVSRDLAGDIRQLPRDQYAAAQKFLTGIKYAAATVGQQVAENQATPQPIAGTELANQ